MRNWTDENFSGFTGGVVISFNNQIIGAAGVSGRKGAKDENDLHMQDNELAEWGRSILHTKPKDGVAQTTGAPAVRHQS